MKEIYGLNYILLAYLFGKFLYKAHSLKLYHLIFYKKSGEVINADYFALEYFIHLSINLLTISSD